MFSDSNIERYSPRRLARIEGILALAGIVTGAFALGYVPSVLGVAGGASATINHILAHETLFRAGFAAHLFEMLTNIAGEIIFFVLIRRVNGIVAAIAMCCGLVGTAIEGLNLLNAYASLRLALEANAFGALTAEQTKSLSYLAMQLHDAGLLISFAFYGLDEILSGLLIFRSGFLPRVLGVMLGLAGLCYFTHSFLSFLAPALDARLYPYILYPCAPGEGAIALWMATVGLNVAKWKAWTPELRQEPVYA